MSSITPNTHYGAPGAPEPEPYILALFDTASRAMGNGAILARYNTIDTDVTTGGAENDYDFTTATFTPTRPGVYHVHASYRAYRGANTTFNGVGVRKNGSMEAEDRHFGFVQGGVETTLYMNGTTDTLQAFTIGNATSTQQQEKRYARFIVRWLHP